MDRVPFAFMYNFLKNLWKFFFFFCLSSKIALLIIWKIWNRQKEIIILYVFFNTFNLYCEYIYENESIKNFIYVLLKNCVIDYPLKYTIFCLQFKWLINFVIVRVNIEESIPKQK